MDVQKFYQVTGILRDSKIKYDYKIQNSKGLNNGKLSTLGFDTKYLQQYYLYVHKKDYENAQFVIYKNG